MTDPFRTLETLAGRATRYVHGMETRVLGDGANASIVALGVPGDAIFGTGTPMELLSRITDGSFRNWLVALRDR